MLWDALDWDLDDRLTVDELLDALGPRALDLLAGEAGDPIPRHAWDGSPEAFDALDENDDGRVDHGELHRGLGRDAIRLLLNGEPPGPELSPGARYEQRGGGLWVVFPGREAKAQYMAEAAERDARDPAVVSWAQQFIRLPKEERAAAILRYCQLALRYERDPAWYDQAGNRHGIEVLDSSAVLLWRGYGDCDAKTRLFLALCKACGVAARLAPVFTGTDGFPHVRAEVLDEKTGRWLIADPSIVNSSIGHLPPHNRTHVLQRRLTARGWEVSDDDGNTWHPMEGGEAGDGEDAPPGGSPAPAARPARTGPGPSPGTTHRSRKFRYTPGSVITVTTGGRKWTQRWSIGADGITMTAVEAAVPATAESLAAADADQKAAQLLPPRPHPARAGGPAAGPYTPGAVVYIGGNWYRIDQTGRATPEGILPNQPPPPPPDQVAAQQAAARRVRHLPPPRRPARPQPAPMATAPAAAPVASMIPSQIPQIISAVPQVISAVGQGISGVTSAVQSIASAFGGFGGTGDPETSGVGDVLAAVFTGGLSEIPRAVASAAENPQVQNWRRHYGERFWDHGDWRRRWHPAWEGHRRWREVAGPDTGAPPEGIPGVSAIISALGATAYRLQDFIANSGGQVHPTHTQADSWLRAFRIDPGLLFSVSHASVEAAARLIRFLKLASGEHPMQHGWRLDSNPYLNHVDPTDPLTDPSYLASIRDAIVGTSDPRLAAKHLALQPVVVTRETAQRMLALLRHELVANGLPHWAEAQAALGDIAGEIQRVRDIAGEKGDDLHLSRVFGDVSFPPAQRAA